SHHAPYRIPHPLSPLTLFVFLLPPPPSSTLFPYTTLFRSVPPARREPADDRRERRFVERGREGQTHQAPDCVEGGETLDAVWCLDRKSTRLNSSHDQISYAVFCLKKKKKKKNTKKEQKTPT